MPRRGKLSVLVLRWMLIAADARIYSHHGHPVANGYRHPIINGWEGATGVLLALMPSDTMGAGLACG